MTTKEYQEEKIKPLASALGGLEVISEWISFRGDRTQYSPRVDIAVGPFNIGPGPNISHEYDNILNTNVAARRFLETAFGLHNTNMETLAPELAFRDFDELIRINENSRCFLSIEIENKNSKKHIMGSVVNACSLGRIGIGVAFSESTLRAFARIMNYLNFLESVGKNTYRTTNFLLLSTEQLDHLIESQ
ncbi:hypothetical protein [Reichenbachiella sp.]|uniref:hypothetical protein n=1 Tax=Reichenbachiella sp. TaxID=2184521 RepID=UPI003297E3FA